MIFLLAAAILASEPTSAPYEVVRAGDRAMACPQLIAEINAINHQIQDQQTRQTAAMTDATSDMMSASGMGAGGMVMSGLGSLAGLIPFGGQALSMGRQAQMMAGQKKMLDQMDALQREAMEMMPVHQRLDHLMTLYQDKAC